MHKQAPSPTLVRSAAQRPQGAMSITKDEARALLRERELRATGPRIAVLCVLAVSERPLSHSDVLAELGDTDWDPATIYRNLVKLRDAGLAPVSRVDGIDRYAFMREDGDEHHHPHFVCEDCGRVACLPAALTESLSMEGPWADSIKQAVVQLRGECPDCLAEGGGSSG
ncbi:transcriptional repressor [Pseudenhygromyxa sp. WMMC2535]|uniref:Fur family transcriptional regulator n=1 Tax=Pseudenhygromyxa sp. WMMC2535 TaxID=2712867 RepID=UPI0015951412|nr:Fur family transcriptional regulator [Pseudenhygromyxa sp. WMMC2535]NVB37015.1 transcriptional repressor [Pseudenhygromyxa sp. WMMC2535]